MKVTLNISGFNSEANFPNKDIAKIHKPIIKKFSRLFTEKQERIVVFLAAPPGCGKSTLASFWEYLSEQSSEYETLQVLPFDGFHYPNEILDTNYIVKDGQKTRLRDIKGSYETFNLTELIDKLKKLKVNNPTWPYYDRITHDPIDDSITVNRNVVVVEGNWLLLNEPVWNGLHELADFTIFVETDPSFLKQRLIERKIRGGTPREDAEEFYQRSDSINVSKVLECSIPADLTLFLNKFGSFEIK